MVFSSAASAQAWNKRTSVTFNAPVQIPGAGAQVLPAGTYVFRCWIRQSDRISFRYLTRMNRTSTQPSWQSRITACGHRQDSNDLRGASSRRTTKPSSLVLSRDNSGQEFVIQRSGLRTGENNTSAVLYIPDELAGNIVTPAETATETPVIALKEAQSRRFNPPRRGRNNRSCRASAVQVAALPRTASNLPLLALMAVWSSV
jgi:hypothetical protein